MKSQVTHAKHASQEGKAVFLPTLEDVFFLRRMHHKGARNDTSLLEDCHIKLFVKDFFEQFVSLRGCEFLKVVLCLRQERKSQEFVCQLNSHPNFFSLHVEDSV